VIATRALPRPTVAAATLTCLVAFALAGCNQSTTATDERPAASTTAPTDPATSAATATTAPTTPSPSTPVETTTSAVPTPTDGPTTDGGGAGGNAVGRLLGAAEVPGFNDEFHWQERATGTSEPGALFGTCQRFGLTSIGAESVALRSFRPAGPGGGTDQAGELVAEFPDSTTARRAFAVLKSWRATCGERLKDRQQVRVGGLKDVPVDGGTSGWYLVKYGPVAGDPDALFFDAQGMAVVGSRIAMVEMILAGQDYNYEPGQEPMVAALQRAAAKLS
jgi:hypothetical protein